MKEYKDIPEKEESVVKEPAVVYEVTQPRQHLTPAPEFKIPRDENGNPIGHTLDEVFDEIDLDWSETSGIDFIKVNRMLDSGELNLDDLTDEMLHSPAFKYEPYLGFKPKPRKKLNVSPEWLAAMDAIFKPEEE
jgi:hypothetical protein